MVQLHALLAVRETRQNALTAMITETQHKLGKPDAYFRGEEVRLKMLKSSPENDAVERAGKTSKALATTVKETLGYFLKQWADNEDVMFQISKTNQIAKADLNFRGNLLVKDVPVSHLLELEGRLENLRKTLVLVPTLDASKSWEIDTQNAHSGAWKMITTEERIKTAKEMKPVILHPATDKHPAQVEKVTDEITVGIYTDNRWSGACSSKQKADLLAVMDDLLVEVKKSRMAANSTEASKEVIGEAITDLLLAVFE